MAFTEYEKEYLRDMLRLPGDAATIATLDSRLTAFNAGQEQITREDMAEFGEVAYGTTTTDGGTRAANTSLERDRIFIINKIRRRLQYAELSTPGSGTDIYGFRISIGKGSMDFAPSTPSGWEDYQ